LSVLVLNSLRSGNKPRDRELPDLEVSLRRI